MEESGITEIIKKELNNILIENSINQEIDLETEIYGHNGLLNSLSLIRLIAVLEQRFAEESGTFITLVDEKVLSSRNSPFKNVGTLVTHIKNQF